ncbi:MAG TPA: tyrosine-type recombinase/integrase [Patescibacteria group bacterium]
MDSAAINRLSSTQIGELTFQELIPRWLDYGETELNYRPETLDKYKYALGYALRKLPTKQVVSPTLLTINDVLALKGALKAAGISENFINIVLSAVKSFLCYCEFAKIPLQINQEEIRKMKVPKRQVVFLTQDEVKSLLGVIKEKGIRGLRQRALAEFLLGTAMRISEALSFNRDVDWEGGSALIIGKGDKQRRIFITERARYWLKEYLSARSDDNPALFVTYGSNPKRLQRYDLSKQFCLLANKAGITKHLTPHVMRHTAATIMMQNGCPITYIQELLGHSDIKTTAKYYLGTDDRSLREAHSKYLKFD